MATSNAIPSDTTQSDINEAASARCNMADLILPAAIKQLEASRLPLIRMLGLVELAQELSFRVNGDSPPVGKATDPADRLMALLEALHNELEALYASNDELLVMEDEEAQHG